MYSLYDDRKDSLEPETGLMPVGNQNRVNYFREFDDGPEVIYSGVNAGQGKTPIAGHYGETQNAEQVIQYNTPQPPPSGSGGT